MTKLEFLKKLLESNQQEIEDKGWISIMKMFSSNIVANNTPNTVVSVKNVQKEVENKVSQFSLNINVSARTLLHCMDLLIKYGEKNFPPRSGSGRGEGKKEKNYKLPWDEIFVHTLQEYKDMRKQLDGLIGLIKNPNIEISVWTDSINTFLDIWATFIAYLEEELRNTAKFVEYKTEINKKLSEIASPLRKYGSFVKCLADNSKNVEKQVECKL